MTEIAAGLLIAGGTCLTVVGLVRGIRAARRDMPDPGRALGFVRGLRISLAGIALTGLGFGWLLEQSWLVALSLAFAGEEMWESSVVIGALRHGVEGPRGRKRIPPPPLRMPTPDTLLPSYRRGG
jgi:hypothetical protein